MMFSQETYYPGHSKPKTKSVAKKATDRMGVGGGKYSLDITI